MSEFKKGDRVRLIRDVDTRGRDKEGTILSVDGGDYQPITVKIDPPFDGHSEGGLCWCVNQRDIELVPKFKDGDRVRYKNNHNIIYTVKGPKTEYSDGSEYDGPPAVVYTIGGWDREDILELVPSTKFKVSDRVISIGAEDAGVGIVKELRSDGLYQVDFQDAWYRLCTENEDNLAFAHAIVSRQPHIVARIVAGCPRPAHTPFVHNDQESANREAARLAAANPGVEFAVYARVGGKIADVTVREAA